jgi:hypothetical protein
MIMPEEGDRVFTATVTYVSRGTFHLDLGTQKAERAHLLAYLPDVLGPKAIMTVDVQRRVDLEKRAERTRRRKRQKP